MSTFLTQPKRSQQAAQAIRPRALQRPNRIRAIREQEERRQAEIAAVVTKSSKNLAIPNSARCPNKACEAPNVVDGTCRGCGRIIDDSNIVAEVQFGETSSGAAIVQGSYIGADQAGVRSLGPGFRRVGASENLEKSIREAKQLMQGFAQQLNISESLVTSGVQAFKLASGANFVQGRTLASVAAVCLYAACRIERPCKIMLLDLADLVRVNVFKLGRTFKALNKAVPICNDGLVPVYPEDLIYRFASKLEFQGMTNKVAEDAVRLVKRMSRDWMVMGRRPSGICGACLLMAARMNNFRRTIREVVYIVKVTNHTIQTRLNEFKFTESSSMTVEDFLKQDFLESSHDPPSFYRKTEEYQAKMREKSRKRKRVVTEDEPSASGAVNPEEAEIMAILESSGNPAAADALEADAQSRTSDPAALLRSASDNTTNTAQVKPNTAETAGSGKIDPDTRRDADGFVIPALPEADGTGIPSLADPDSAEALDELMHDFGDQDQRPAETQEDETEDIKTGKRERKPKPALPVNDDWEEDEANLEEQISEMVNDPHTMEHAMAFSTAQQRAQLHTQWAHKQRPQKAVSMAAEVGEDEFADDPEVVNCLLTEEESRIKELVWVNENKDWLRLQQEKVFQRKLAADKPKVTRRRKKRPRIGEGQLTPASTPGEAAVNVMKERSWSRRINYDAIRSLFDMPSEPGSGAASEMTSQPTSYAGSAAGDGNESDLGDETEPLPEDEIDNDDEDDLHDGIEDEEGYGHASGYGDEDEDDGGYDDDD